MNLKNEFKIKKLLVTASQNGSLYAFAKECLREGWRLCLSSPVFFEASAESLTLLQ
jgi:hypothetical protein